MLQASEQQKPRYKIVPGSNFLLCILAFYYLEHLHGASLSADAAGDALGSLVIGHNNDLHGAGLGALAAANAQLLVDHINALGVLGDSTGLADLGALAALDTYHGLRSTVLLNDSDAGLVLVELFVECLGAGDNAGFTCHALDVLLYSKLFQCDVLLKYIPWSLQTMPAKFLSCAACSLHN